LNTTGLEYSLQSTTDVLSRKLPLNIFISVGPKGLIQVQPSPPSCLRTRSISTILEGNDVFLHHLTLFE